ncbi:ATP-grasp domain-containing protein [Aquabacterium sp.]|uniref:ATP-grasp domain-containing protein n=1 Tax=Aquabacterium sp. TaxID=1872578 RepID=UPI004037D19A
MKKLIVNVMCRSLAWEKREEISACIEKGYGVVVLDKDPAAYADLPVDHFVSCDVTDVERSAALALSYIEQHKLSIAGVVGWTDTAVYLVAHLAAALGLPGTAPSRVEAVKDKAKTRRLLEAVNGANPPYKLVESLADLGDALDVIGTPCVLKYPGASGGRGIIHVDEPVASVDALYAEFRAMCDPAKDTVFNQRAQQFVVEKKVRGSEHSVAGLVNGGKVSILAVVDKEVDLEQGYQYRNTVPSRLSTEVQERMCAIARRAIELSGIDACGFHVDMMVEENTPYVLEIGGRLGGECINSHLISMATKHVRPYHMLVDVVTGFGGVLDEDYRGELKYAASMLSLYGCQYGRIAQVQGLDQVQALRGVVQVLQVRKPGDSILPPSQKYNSLVYAHVLLKGKDIQDVAGVAEQVQSLAAVSIETPVTA